MGKASCSCGKGSLSANGHGIGDPPANASAHAFEMPSKEEKSISEKSEELKNPKLSILTKEKTPKKPRSSPDQLVLPLTISTHIESISQNAVWIHTLRRRLGNPTLE